MIKTEKTGLPVSMRIEDSGKLKRLTSISFIEFASLMHPFSSLSVFRYEIPTVTAFLRPRAAGGGGGGGSAMALHTVQPVEAAPGGSWRHFEQFIASTFFLCVCVGLGDC